MKKRGKIVYLGYSEYKGLEDVGKKYVSKTFLDGKKHVSYSKSVRFLLDLVKVNENIKNAPRMDKDEDDERNK